MLTLSELYYPMDAEQAIDIENFHLAQGQSLLVLGDNASGKSVLAQILLGEIKNYRGQVNLSDKIAGVGFDLEEKTLDYDRRHDNSEFIEGGIDWGRNAEQIITEDIPADELVINKSHFDYVIELLDIAKLLDKPFKVLSTGETRKVLIAKALVLKPVMLILDEPYAGLDLYSQAHLTQVLEQLIADGTSVVLFDFYRDSLPKNIDQLLYLQAGQIVLSGQRSDIIKTSQWRELNQTKVSLPHSLPDSINYEHISENVPYIALNDVSVSFNGKGVFSSLSWEFNQGEHWRVRGPNGCGKSTLLSMISGDSTKAYGKELYLFGNKRGSGETVWDIKRHYGVVSGQLHRDYRVSMTLVDTVISGFFDSIGLYDQPQRSQITIAHEWLSLLGLSDKASCYFSELSYGEQRMVLIARAVVKLPLILVLDEPCQGLDNHNRVKVLALIDYIAAHSNTHILFVSHDVRDVLSCLTHELEFIPHEEDYICETTVLSDKT